MNTDRTEMNRLTEKVIGAVFEVSNTLGAGFLEKVYERALVTELGLRGVRAAAQVPLQVSYKGHEVGEYFADIVVEDELIVELKAAHLVADEHVAQLLGYLRASRIEHGLLVNFGAAKFQIKKYIQNDFV